MNTEREIPAIAFRKILPFVGFKDMKNIGEAVKASENLYEEFSFYTKRDSNEVFPEARLICPYCLVAGGFRNPWLRLQHTIFGLDHRVINSASATVTLFRSGPEMLLESQTLEQIRSQNPSIDSELPVRLDPMNAFLSRLTTWSTEGVENGKSVRCILIALRDLEIFTSSKDLIKHVEDTHHPTGKNWRKLPPGYLLRAKELKNEFVRAEEIDELGSLLDNKKFRGLLRHQSPRKNVILKKAISDGIISNRRRYGQNVRFMNIPIHSNDKNTSENYHRTLALAYQLEDDINNSNKQFSVIPARLHKILALRNYLACMIEVFEDIQFTDLNKSDMNRLGMYNAVKIVLDHVIKLPY